MFDAHRLVYKLWLPVCIVDISWIVLKGDGKVLLEDEVEDHHHLHGSLDAPADAVAHLYNNKPLDEDKDMQGINTEMGFPPHKKKDSQLSLAK